MLSLNEEMEAKWGPVLDHKSLAPIADLHRRSVTAVVLENTERAVRTDGRIDPFTLTETSSPVPYNAMGSSSSTAGSGAIDTFDPILISLVRRAMPNLIAYDVCGTQPMTGPTGLIFAMRSRYANSANTQNGPETFYGEVNTAWSTVLPNGGAGNTAVFGGGMVGNVVTNPFVSNNYNTATGMSTAQGEALGSDSNAAFAQMSFSIEKVTVTAETRALAASYTMELAQDLKAIHGLDAETELSNILSAELLAEINREIVRTINITAVTGAQQDTTTAGIFDLDTDSNGRWSVEKFKGLMFQLEREANQIAKQTRRGKGNIMICSADVASALNMTGVLSYTPALAASLNVDDTGNTFAGLLNGRIKVYIDPYAIGGNYFTMGFKGANAFDAGLFYCPYVPLQMVRAVDQMTFQPKIGFKTRYGVVANPYAQGYTKGLGALNINSNVYYRRVQVNNIL